MEVVVTGLKNAGKTSLLKVLMVSLPNLVKVVSLTETWLALGW